MLKLKVKHISLFIAGVALAPAVAVSFPFVLAKEGSLQKVLSKFQDKPKTVPQDNVAKIDMPLTPAEKAVLKAKYNNKKFVQVDKDFLRFRTSSKYGKQKWITFCEKLLAKNYSIAMYETEDKLKYIHIDSVYTVVISRNAIIPKQKSNNYNFLVGKHKDGSCTTIEDALLAVDKFFKHKQNKKASK